MSGYTVFMVQGTLYMMIELLHGHSVCHWTTIIVSYCTVIKCLITVQGLHCQDCGSRQYVDIVTHPLVAFEL